MAIRLRCAVCGKPVDRVITDLDPVARVRRLTAECHGEVDQMTITYDDIGRWTLEEQRQWYDIVLGMVEGVAFATGRISHGPPQG